VHVCLTVVTVAEHTSICTVYDFTVQPVSVHLPLTRLLASLYILLDEPVEVGITLLSRQMIFAAVYFSLRYGISHSVRCGWTLGHKADDANNWSLCSSHVGTAAAFDYDKLLPH